jgi:hypothetical protein
MGGPMTQAKAASEPAPAPPLRRPGSVRRTSTIMMFWPDGPANELHLKGRARDLLTPAAGDPQELNLAEMSVVTANRTREILQITTLPDPEPAGVQNLVGKRAGGGLRAAISEELPEEVEAGTPLHLLLDDMGGTTLIAGFTFIRWKEHVPILKERMDGSPRPYMQDTCSGFRPGAISLFADGTMSGIPQNTVHPATLDDPSDPLSWHALDDHPDMAMRRARRIDVWAEGERIRIDAMFRDSCWDPDGQESVIHEYQLFAEGDRDTGVLESVTAQPRVLPYPECSEAAPKAAWMQGLPMRDLRREVLARLKSVDCCTHLNDGLRSLAEVPVLAAALP